MNNDQFWEERRKEHQQDRLLNGLLMAAVALIITISVFLVAMSVTVDLYLKVKNNGGRQIHAIEVVKP